MKNGVQARILRALWHFGLGLLRGFAPKVSSLPPLLLPPRLLRHIPPGGFHIGLKASKEAKAGRDGSFGKSGLPEDPVHFLGNLSIFNVFIAEELEED